MAQFSVSTAFTEGWERFAAHWKFLIGITLLYLIVSGGLGGVSTHSVFSNNLPTIFGTHLLSLAATSVLSVFLVKLTLDIYDTKPVSWGTLFTGLDWTTFWRYVGATILVGLAVTIGFICLILPGLYLALKYSQVRYLIVDKKMRVFEALSESSRLTVGIKWKLIGFSFLVLLLVLVSLIPVGLGLLISLPWSLLAIVSVYRQLNQSLAESTIVTPPAKPSSLKS